MVNVTVRRLPDGEELVLADARETPREHEELERRRIRRPETDEPVAPRPRSAPRPPQATAS